MEFWGRNGRLRLWPVSLLLGLLLATGLARLVYAQDGRLSLDDYWAAIAEIRTELSAADGDAETVRQAAAERLAAISEIELPDGRLQPIDHAFLIRQLQSESVENEALGTIFTAYMSSRQGWPDPAFPQLDSAALEDILSQPAFDYAPEEPNFFQRLWQDIRQWVEDFFLQLFPENSALRVPLNNLILFLALGLVLIALAYAMRGLIADFTADAALSAEDELGGEPLTAELALQRAEDLSTGGDFRTAVRYLYLSALLLLEERGLLRYDRSLTNREYLRTVAHRPELAAVLRDVIEVFDRVWYGFQNLDGAEYARYAQQVETLKQQREVR